MRIYGEWSGRPKGTLEDPARCIVEVANGGRSVLFHQCNRKRGYGTNGQYCKQHAKSEGRNFLGREVSEVEVSK